MTRQKGLSLVELLIAITLGLILVGGVIQVFLSSRVVFSTQQSISRVQESGRFAIDFISQELRLAGYMGCADENMHKRNNIPQSGDFWNNYIAANNSVNAVQIFTNAAPPVTLNPAPLAGDILVVRYATGTPVVLTDMNTPGVLPVTGPLSGGCMNGLCVGSQAVVTNCVGANLFIVNSISATAVSHTGTWPGGSIISTTENFMAGNEILRLATVIFYVANNPAGKPSLYRVVNGGTPLEMVEGVQRMRLQTSGGLVRVHLLLQGDDANVLDAARNYQLGDVAITGLNDRRYRQVFSTSVAVRS